MVKWYSSGKGKRERTIAEGFRKLTGQAGPLICRSVPPSFFCFLRCEKLNDIERREHSTENTEDIEGFDAFGSSRRQHGQTVRRFESSTFAQDKYAVIWYN